MPYLYLIISVFMSASSSIFGEFFNKQCAQRKDSAAFYNFLQMTVVFLCWCVLYAFNFSFEVTVLWYAVLFAVCFTVCNIAIINALKHGPTALTSLFVSLSLILTTVWGIIFWESQITVPVVIGLVLVCVAIYLCLRSGKKEEKGGSWKWLVCAVLALVGNAGCSIVQRTQQMQYGGRYGNMLMAFATLFSAVVCFLIYIKSDKSDTAIMLKRAWSTPILAGVCNVALNVFVMLLALTELPPSLIYPVIGVGGLGIVSVFSLFAFKEKMYWWQWIGIAIGVVAVALLSI